MNGRHRLFHWTLALLFAALWLPGASLAQPANYRVMNRGKEGQVFAITEFLTRGKVNLVVFVSPACPYSQALDPRLSALASRRPDLAIGRVVIDRPGSNGIDWQSPLARQYEVRSVPLFKIYDASGKLQAEGETARKMVAKMLLEQDIL